MTEQDILHILLQVSKGLSYMHNLSPPVAHRDLKAENILQSLKGEWLLCDFGSASTNHKVFQTPSEIAAEEEIVSKNTTSAYRAPELYDLYSQQLVDTKVDVWALGVLLYLMCYGKFPFQPDAKLQVLKGNYDMPPSHHSHHTQQLVRAMLNVQAALRPTVDQVIQCINAILAGRSPPPESYGGLLTPAQSFSPPASQPVPPQNAFMHGYNAPPPGSAPNPVHHTSMPPASHPPATHLPPQEPVPAQRAAQPSAAPSFDPFAASEPKSTPLATFASPTAAAPPRDPFSEAAAQGPLPASSSASRVNIPAIPPFSGTRASQPSSQPVQMPPQPISVRPNPSSARPVVPPIPPYVPKTPTSAAATASQSSTATQLQFDPFAASASAQVAPAAPADPFANSASFNVASSAANGVSSCASTPQHAADGAQGFSEHARWEKSAPLQSAARGGPAAERLSAGEQSGAGGAARQGAASVSLAAAVPHSSGRPGDVQSAVVAKDEPSPLRNLVGIGMRSMRSLAGRKKDGVRPSADDQGGPSSELGRSQVVDEEKDALIRELKAQLSALTADKAALKQELSDAFSSFAKLRRQAGELRAENASLRGKLGMPEAQARVSGGGETSAAPTNGRVDAARSQAAAGGSGVGQEVISAPAGAGPVAQAVVQALNKSRSLVAKAHGEGHRRGFSDVGVIDWKGLSG